MSFNFFKLIIMAGSLGTLLLVLGCQKKKIDLARLSPEQLAAHNKSKLLARGKALYIAECIVCHNLNPKMAGATGPEIYGSSLELVTARILTLGYPPGYKPKRDTELMPEFDHLEEDIPAIHAFLNTP